MDSKMSDTLRFYWSAVYLIGFLLPLVAVLVSFSGLFRFVRKMEFKDGQHRFWWQISATGFHSLSQGSAEFLYVHRWYSNFFKRKTGKDVQRHTSGSFSNWCSIDGTRNPRTISTGTKSTSVWKPSKVNSTGNNDHHAQVKYTIIRTTIVYTITVTCSWLPVIILVSKIFLSHITWVMWYEQNHGISCPYL